MARSRGRANGSCCRQPLSRSRTSASTSFPGQPGGRKPWTREPPSYRGLGRYLRFLGPRDPKRSQPSRSHPPPARPPDAPPKRRSSPSLQAAALQLMQGAGSKESVDPDASEDDPGMDVAVDEVLQAAQAAHAAPGLGQMGWSQRLPLSSSSQPRQTLRPSSHSSSLTTRSENSKQRAPIPSVMQKELAEWELEHVPDISPFLHTVSTQHVCHIQRLSFLCAAVYSIDSMKRFRALELMGMQLVDTSIPESTPANAYADEARDAAAQRSAGLDSAALAAAEDTRDREHEATEQEHGEREKRTTDAGGTSWLPLPSIPWLRRHESKAEEADTSEQRSRSRDTNDNAGYEDSNESIAAALAREAMDVDQEFLVGDDNKIVAGIASWARPLASRTASGKNQSGYSFLQAVAPLTRAAAAGSATASQALASTVRPLAEASRGGGIVAPAALAGLVSSAATATKGGMNREYAQGPDENKQHIGCPCAWYVADEPATCTRRFVIEGTNSVSSWQVNVQFDPVEFESPELDLNIHRGVYKAACDLYDTVLEYVEQHAMSSGFVTTPSFVLTGHSLGGSLALVITMMMSWRRPDLRWILGSPYQFGSPSVISDNRVNADGTTNSPWRNRSIPLERVGLPPRFAMNVFMHLDLVPRAFSCDYTLVRNVLSGWAEMFGRHACLQDVSCSSLYGPCGVQIVLQPDTQYADQHPYLPLGSGVYEVCDPPYNPLAQQVTSAVGSLISSFGADKKLEQETNRAEAESNNVNLASSDVNADASTSGADSNFSSGNKAAGECEYLDGGSGEVDADEDIRDASEALYAIVNTPHPLEILSDWRAYGTTGAVSKNHNPFTYARALACELKSRKDANPVRRTLPRTFL